MGKTVGNGRRERTAPSDVPHQERMSLPETASWQESLAASDGTSPGDAVDRAQRGARSTGVSTEEVQKTVDAVSGATWGTRNRIMAGLFQRDLRTRGDDMPAFAPPGEDIPR